MPLPSTNVELVAPFVRASESVFRTMLTSRCTPGEWHEVNSETPLGELSACVELTGGLNGAITFHTQQLAALQIVERMTGIPAEEAEELVRDSVREIANMISGHGKRELESHRLDLGLPCLEIHPVQRPRQYIHHIWIPLETDIGWCGIDVGFHPQ